MKAKVGGNNEELNEELIEYRVNSIEKQLILIWNTLKEIESNFNRRLPVWVSMFQNLLFLIIGGLIGNALK